MFRLPTRAIFRRERNAIAVCCHGLVYSTQVFERRRRVTCRRLLFCHKLRPVGDKMRRRARPLNEANILKYTVAVAELRNSGDPLKLAHAIRHLGDAYYYAGETKTAEPYYVEALSIYRSRDDWRPLDLANAIRSYAVIKSELGATDEAQRLWQEAHDLYVSLNVTAGVAGSAAQLALLAQRQNDLRQTREWLTKAIKAAQVANDPEISQFVADVTARIGAP